MRFRSLTAFVAALVLIGFGLTGCGQKGPLVPPKAQLSAAPIAVLATRFAPQRELPFTL
jgi:predicted small lipoprotein YifL